VLLKRHLPHTHEAVAVAKISALCGQVLIYQLSSDQRFEFTSAIRCNVPIIIIIYDDYSDATH